MRGNDALTRGELSQLGIATAEGKPEPNRPVNTLLISRKSYQNLRVAYA